MSSPAESDICYRLAALQDEVLLSQIHYIASYTHLGMLGEDIPSLECAMRDASFNRYFMAWGRPGDTGIIAGDRAAEITVGAAWYRQYSTLEQHAIIEAGVAIPPHEISIGVTPPYQGSGIGKTMLRMLMYQAQYDGIPTLSLGVNLQNQRAQHLYQAVGFQPMCVFDNHEIMKASLEQLQLNNIPRQVT